MSDRHWLPLEECTLPPLLARRAKDDASRIYLREADRVWTFGQVSSQASAFARGLAARGVGKGDRVALHLPNISEFIFSWFGCALVGAATVPVNTMYTAPLLDYVLRDSAPVGLVTHAAFLPAVRSLPAERLSALRWIVVVAETSGLDEPWSRYADFLRDDGALPEITPDFRELHCVMYTSGTTGPSKGVLATNGHFIGGARTFLDIVDLQREDRIFSPLPLFHGVASRMGCVPALMTGAQIVIAERFSVSQFWRQLAESGATLAHTIFTIPPMLKSQPPGPWDRAHKVRAMYNANTDPEFEARFNLRLVEGYGLTETGPCIYSPWPETRPNGSSGRVHPDFEAAIVDDRGFQLGAHAKGEIVVRPKLPSLMMAGYLNKPEATLEAMRDFWFHTGDIGHRDDDGYFYFLSRIKERIRRRGENVSAFEVEMIVATHPAVLEVAALPYPSPHGEDDVRIVVARRAGTQLGARSLMDWLVGRMPYFMMPRYIEFIDRLPRNPLEKVEKYRLVQAGLGTQVWDREAEGYELVRSVTPGTS